MATGVKVLWATDFAWGGHTAWLLAFLWGTGAQVAGGTFAGVLALRAKLGS